MEKDKDILKNIIQDKENQFSIPIQNSIVNNIKSKGQLLPKIKLIDVDDYQSKLYHLEIITKPISKIIELNEK